MASYNAVPLPAALGASSSDAAAPEIEASTSTSVPKTAAQQRLAALKSKHSDARKQNHKAVVAEDRRDKLGEAGLKAERREKAWEKKQQQQDAAGGAPTAAQMMLETTAAAAEEKLHKEEKKGKRRAEYGWDVFNNEAQYRHYKKQTRRAEADGRAPGGEDVFDEGDPDPLAYGQAPPVPKERVQALVEDMHEAALRRASWSRRRTFHEERDVTYINKRNEVYNKKIERAFDPYTEEIRANLERGTAL
jgi:pre-mRNA-splicing factor SYF2